MRRETSFWLTVVIVSLLLVIAVYLYMQQADVVEERISTLTSRHEAQLDLYQQRVSLLLTLATLVVGGAGALLLHLREHGRGSTVQRRLAVLSIVTAGASAFAGYLAQDAAIWMLGAEFFNLNSLLLKVPSVAQLWLSGLAILLLAACFIIDSPSGGIEGNRESAHSTSAIGSAERPPASRTETKPGSASSSKRGKRGARYPQGDH